MLLETLLIIGIVIGFLNSRSTTLADRALSGNILLRASLDF